MGWEFGKIYMDWRGISRIDAWKAMLDLKSKA